MKYLKLLDFFGRNFTFTIDKKDKYQTLVGSLFTITLLLLSVLFAVIFGRDFFNKSNPLINYQNVMGLEYFREVLNTSNFLVPWQIIDGNGYPVNYDGIIYPRVKYYRYVYNNNISAYSTISAFELNSSLCDSNYSSMMPGVSLYNCLNIDKLNLTIGGGWDGDFVDYFSITLYYCNNYGNYDPQANCTSIENLNKFFGKTIYFSIFYPNLHFEGNNYTNPFQIQYVNYYYQLSAGLVKTDRYYFEKAILQDDKGSVLQNMKNSSIYYTYSLKSDYFVTNPNLYNKTGTLSVIYQSIFYLEKNYDLYTRSYMKLQSLTAQIGGFINIIEIFCSMLTAIINKYYRNIRLINKIFDFEEASSDHIKIKKNFDNLFNEKMENLEISEMKNDKSDLKMDKSSNHSGNSKIIFFKKNDSSKDKRIDLDNNKGESLDNKFKHLIKSYESKKKFNPSILLILKNLICCGRLNNNEEKIIEFYNISKKIIEKKLDLNEYLKLIESVDTIKSFFFSNEQIISLKYLKRINLNNATSKELIKEILKNDKLSDLKLLFHYFKNKFETNSMSDVDRKIFDLLDENFKTNFRL